MRLAVRTPFAGRRLLDFLAHHLVPGVEVAGPGWYARTLDLPHGPGTVRLGLADTATAGETAFVTAEFSLHDLRDTSAAVERVRRLLDADCDPVAVDDHLADDPVIGRLVRATPGLRVPGQVDGDETAVRTVIGQQVSVTGARTVTGRIVAEHGRPLETGRPGPDPPLPGRRHAGARSTRRPCRCRARGVARWSAWPRALAVRRRRAGPRPRPRRRTPRAPRAARHRPLDRRLRRDARAGPPRRLPAHRPRPCATCCATSRGTARRRALATVALLRADAPVEHPHARHLGPRSTEGDLTCGP